jgi:hypothetical protein
MARNSFRRTRTEPADRAPIRTEADPHAAANAAARADSWCALASAAVASALVVAFAVCALALIEAVVSKPASVLAQRFPASLESQRGRSAFDRPLRFSASCAWGEPARCIFD